MKTLLAFAIFAATGLSAQVFVDVPITLPDPSSQSFNLPTTLKAVSFPNIIAWIKQIPANGGFPNTPSTIPLSTTLAAPVNDKGTHAACTMPGASASSVCSTITLTSATNLAQCNGLLFASGEMTEVYSVSGNTALIFRGLIATTSATHLSGEAVTVTRVGDGVCLLKSLIADGLAAITLREQADTTTSAAASAIAAQQATIQTTAQGAIQ